ncbi:phosphatidylglycerophosphatase A [Halomonas piscis]|uniref:Phosphatidylglycerophosphatase A n=1 Tax=Halomonas piscis TaxID=3031727 RepID=A0ABY9Z2D4_9GAMM|nr:phosphatidylglycerophosphatase A [Halomonas piscis]WNK21008.1 phosphatidylglycerophosphatase A [Halomonas piscis]
MDTLTLWLATGLGVGFMPVAPGTFGSLWGLPLAWWLGDKTPGRQASLVAIMALLAVPICHWASVTHFAGGDAGSIVLDEIVAFPLALLGLAFTGRPAARQLSWLALAFALFRAFDALKPPPVSWVETLPGGIGIVADDLVAAGLAWGCMALIMRAGQRYRQA